MAHLHIARTQGELCVTIYGELDHHAASSLREEIDAEVLAWTPSVLVLDFSGITFMDSSGIGLILGRNTLMQALGGQLIIQDPPLQAERVLKLAGIAAKHTTYTAR